MHAFCNEKGHTAYVTSERAGLYQHNEAEQESGGIEMTQHLAHAEMLFYTKHRLSRATERGKQS